MKLLNTYAIGTHVTFYEIEMLPEYIDGIINSISEVENKENLTYEFIFNMSEFFEKINTSEMPDWKLQKKFESEMGRLEQTGVKLQYTYKDGNIPYSISEYRRDFIYTMTNKHDFLIWGETDCFFPREGFGAIEQISNYAKQNNIYKYVVTFGIRKMWDDSWKVLEHVDFENCKYYEKSEPECFTEQSSIRYYMSMEEMNEINKRYPNLDIRVLNYPQFDGSMAIFSSDLLKSGVNIPLGSSGIAHEDSFMMDSCRKIMGDNYRQFIVKNILKVHNREHPKKRNYALDHEDNDSTQANKGSFYKKCNQLNLSNLQNIMQNSQQRFLTLNDIS